MADRPTSRALNVNPPLIEKGAQHQRVQQTSRDLSQTDDAQQLRVFARASAPKGTYMNLRERVPEKGTRHHSLDSQLANKDAKRFWLRDSSFLFFT